MMMIDKIKIEGQKTKMKRIAYAGTLVMAVLILQIITNPQRETLLALPNSRRALRGGSYSSGGRSSSSHSSGSSYHSSSSSSSSRNSGSGTSSYHSSSSSSSGSSSRNSGSGTSSYHSSSSSSSSSSSLGNYNNPSYNNRSYNNNSSYNNGNYRHGGGSGASKMIFFIAAIALLALLGCVCCPGVMGAFCCGVAASGAAAAYFNGKSYPESYVNGSNGGGDSYFPPSPYNNNNHSNNNNMNPNEYDNAREEFEECARRAKDEVENAPTSTSSQQLVPPYSGDYTTSYVDRTTGVQHGAVLHLSFTPDFRGKGYKLSGEGRDIDGDTVIEDGHVNYDGTAWWRERTITKDVGLIVLSRGTFDFSKRTFNGTWLASTMEHGSYIIFEAAANGAMQQQSPSAPPQDFDDNNGSHIPVVTATIVYAQDHDIPYVPASVVTPSAPIENKK